MALNTMTNKPRSVGKSPATDGKATVLLTGGSSAVAHTPRGG
jgi:hypothetical protein